MGDKVPALFFESWATKTINIYIIITGDNMQAIHFSLIALLISLLFLPLAGRKNQNQIYGVCGFVLFVAIGLLFMLKAIQGIGL